MDSQKIIFIVGPTAVGKSDIAFHLAQKIDGEIISCDAMQVYLELRILTNKPAQSFLKKVSHHLLDVVSISENFDVGHYRTQAERAIEAVLKFKKVPVVVGGSGMYMKILLDGIFDGAPKNEELRKRLFEEAEQEDSEFLFRKLKELDPAAAQKIHPNDTKRLVRAIEVCVLNKQSISVLQKQRSGIWGKYPIQIFGLNRDRRALYRTIDERVDQMFDEGAVEEIEKLKNQSWSLTAKRTIGVREILAYLDGKTTLTQTRDLIKLHTRHYAKRQLTWFRAEKRLQWIELDENATSKATAMRILKEIKD